MLIILLPMITTHFIFQNRKQHTRILLEFKNLKTLHRKVSFLKSQIPVTLGMQYQYLYQFKASSSLVPHSLPAIMSWAKIKIPQDSWMMSPPPTTTIIHMYLLRNLLLLRKKYHRIHLESPFLVLDLLWMNWISK